MEEDSEAEHASTEDDEDEDERGRGRGRRGNRNGHGSGSASTSTKTRSISTRRKNDNEPSTHPARATHFPSLNRLGLMGVTIPSEVLNPFVLAFPRLTHLVSTRLQLQFHFNKLESPG